MKIYIDMDGVLADFDKGLIELLNIQPMSQGNQPLEDQNKMWKAISEYGHFYRDLKPVSDAENAFNKIYSAFGGNIEILTGVPKPERNIPSASEDKIEWVIKYLSPNVKVNTVLRKEKINFCKGKECILIDDYKKNCDEWDKMGGTAVLFTDWNKAIEKVKDLSCVLSDNFS